MLMPMVSLPKSVTREETTEVNSKLRRPEGAGSAASLRRLGYGVRPRVISAAGSPRA